VGKAGAVDGVVERLKARLPECLRVEALILFGSRAQGAEDEWSDYDFVVVSPDFEGVPFMERGRLMFLLRERGVSYDFLCYTPEEYSELARRPTVVREASERGIRVL
jgi:predicted nucleotidyltransferase